MAAQIPGEVLAANEFYSLVVQHRGSVFDAILRSQSVSKLLKRVLFSAWPLQVSQADAYHSTLSISYAALSCLASMHAGIPQPSRGNTIAVKEIDQVRSPNMLHARRHHFDKAMAKDDVRRIPGAATHLWGHARSCNSTTQLLAGTTPKSSYRSCFRPALSLINGGRARTRHSLHNAVYGVV